MVINRSTTYGFGLGIRFLFERHGKMHLMRLGVYGKMISDHELPFYAPAFFGTNVTTPKIENYGDVNEYLFIHNRLILIIGMHLRRTRWQWLFVANVTRFDWRIS